MRSTLKASLDGVGERQRELVVRDDPAVLGNIWQVLERLIDADGTVPRVAAPVPLQDGHRRRGVSDAPPSAITGEDLDVVTVNDRGRLEELVFNEPKVLGRKGRPPKSYRVDAEKWGPAFRAFQLLFPEVAASWEEPRPWWVPGTEPAEDTVDDEGTLTRTEQIDARQFARCEEEADGVQR